MPTSMSSGLQPARTLEQIRSLSKNTVRVGCASHPVLVRIPHDPAGARADSLVRQRKYARRALERCALALNAPLAGWSQDTHGRPEPLNGHFWSIAHKRDWAAAVIAAGPVGIDVEHIRPRNELAWNAMAGLDEWALLERHGIAADQPPNPAPLPEGSRRVEPPANGVQRPSVRPWLAFFRMWTAKEAVLKANGVGLKGLDDCRLIELRGTSRLVLVFGGTAFEVEQIVFGDHIAAVTCGPELVFWHTLNE